MPFYVNPIFPNNTYDYSNINNIQNYDIKELENKINNLEKEICNLKNKITRLETINNYTSNYQANSYNIM